MDKEHKYYDANVLIPETGTLTTPTLLKLVESLVIDGYKGFALNVFKRAPLLDKELVPIPKLDIASVMKQALGKSLTLRKSMDWDFSEIEQYSRITIEISDQKHAAIFTDSHKIYKTYDIIAVRPTNEKLFLQCCSQIGMIHYNSYYHIRLRYNKSRLIRETRILPEKTEHQRSNCPRSDF